MRTYAELIQTYSTAAAEVSLLELQGLILAKINCVELQQAWSEWLSAMTQSFDSWKYIDGLEAELQLCKDCGAFDLQELEDFELAFDLYLERNDKED